MPAAKKPRKKNMQDVPISYYQSLERRVDKLEATVAKLTKPQPRDPRADAYWRKLAQVIGAANAKYYRRVTGQSL